MGRVSLQSYNPFFCGGWRSNVGRLWTNCEETVLGGPVEPSISKSVCECENYRVFRKIGGYLMYRDIKRERIWKVSLSMEVYLIYMLVRMCCVSYPNKSSSDRYDVMLSRKLKHASKPHVTTLMEKGRYINGEETLH